VRRPAPADTRYELASGAFALAPGFVWLERTRTLVAADVHFGYEDVVGGALPLWSMSEVAATISLAARGARAREIVLLGDVIHGTAMSDGAARAVTQALDAMRAEAAVLLIAGNHEGRTRGRAVLGETAESAERDGWLLLHGDVPAPLGMRAIIGHLHPSLPMGGGAGVPCFLGGDALIVAPAMTPYSPGLSVLSKACARALARWNAAAGDLHVVATTSERVYPFGALSRLRAALERKGERANGVAGHRRKHLRPD
jgi:metallophosphoesterase superfamily enzyme